MISIGKRTLGYPVSISGSYRMYNDFLNIHDTLWTTQLTKMRGCWILIHVIVKHVSNIVFNHFIWITYFFITWGIHVNVKNYDCYACNKYVHLEREEDLGIYSFAFGSALFPWIRCPLILFLRWKINHMQSMRSTSLDPSQYFIPG